MSFLNYFKSITTISADEVREMIKGKNPEEFCLLDVRQPKEYEQGHIPGAILIPIAQLPERLDELDPKKPTIAYCAIGGRSRAGASILQDAGFSESYNLKGGFNAWNGLSVEGPPETGMAYFTGVETPEDVLSLAWALEEGSRRFYQEMVNITEDPEAKKVYDSLKEAEKKHQKYVTDLYDEITGNAPDTAAPFYTKHLSENEMEQLMEGQMKLGEVLAWARQHSLNHVLEYSISLEAKLYDLYFRMKEKYTEPTANKIYSKLAAEEKNHLDVFTDLLENNT
ncbi:MAG: rhodanese-like domain-containing protein [Candidatus Aminicenantes bacterium]|jgi:rhodanese-related sulfurtransferase/rubrerythrin